MNQGQNKTYFKTKQKVNKWNTIENDLTKLISSKFEQLKLFNRAMMVIKHEINKQNLHIFPMYLKNQLLFTL